MIKFDQFSTNYTEILNHTLAISGDKSDFFADYKARFVAESVPQGFSGKVLDFGCGVGLLSTFIKKRLPACLLHGYDVSSKCVGMIDKSLCSEGRFTSDSTQLDWDYDLIVLANVMHHVPLNERQNIILECRDRLSPNGRLFVFEHNPANPFTRWIVGHCPLDQDAVLLWPKEVLSYMRKARLHLVKYSFILFFPRLLSWLRPLEQFLRWCPLGAQYAFLSEKKIENAPLEMERTDALSAAARISGN